MTPEAHLERLRSRFVERAGEQMKDLRQRRAPEALADEDHRRALRGLAHSLAGAGGSFGFPALSERAAALEAALDSGAAPAEVAGRVGDLLDELDRLCR